MKLKKSSLQVSVFFIMTNNLSKIFSQPEMKTPPIQTILRPFGGVLRRFQRYLNKIKHFTLSVTQEL